MSWEETLHEVVRRYYRAGPADPPDWVRDAASRSPAPVALANATCGDRVVVHLESAVESGNEPRRIWLDVAGCAICKASAEMVVRAGEVLSPDDLAGLARQMLARIEDRTGSETTDTVTMGRSAAAVPSEDLEAMLTLRDVPGRSRCASLPWEAVLHALESSR